MPFLIFHKGGRIQFNWVHVDLIQAVKSKLLLGNYFRKGRLFVVNWRDFWSSAGPWSSEILRKTTTVQDEGGHSDGVLAQPGEGRKCWLPTYGLPKPNTQRDQVRLSNSTGHSWWWQTCIGKTFCHYVKVVHIDISKCGMCLGYSRAHVFRNDRTSNLKVQSSYLETQIHTDMSWFF